MVAGTMLQRLLYGDVLDAYGTGVFGEGVTRSESSKRKLRRLAELNQKELEGGPLPDKERAEQLELKQLLPTASSTRDAAH
jgi:hypothetical protein